MALLCLTLCTFIFLYPFNPIRGYRGTGAYQLLSGVKQDTATMHAHTQLQTEKLQLRFKPGAYFMWDDGANYHTTLQPKSIIFKLMMFCCLAPGFSCRHSLTAVCCCGMMWSSPTSLETSISQCYSTVWPRTHVLHYFLWHSCKHWCVCRFWNILSKFSLLMLLPWCCYCKTEAKETCHCHLFKRKEIWVMVNKTV